MGKYDENTLYKILKQLIKILIFFKLFHVFFGSCLAVERPVMEDAQMSALVHIHILRGTSLETSPTEILNVMPFTNLDNILS